MVDDSKLIDVIIGVLLPPVRVYQHKKKITSEVIICVFLWCLGLLPGMWYAFTITGMDYLVALCCIILPPFGYYMGQKKCDQNL